MKRWILLGGLAMIAALVAGTFAVGNMLVAPSRGTLVSPPEHLRPETLQLESPSGATLTAWLFVPAEPRAAAVVLHGVRANRGDMASRAELLLNEGLVVLVPDLQAHGDSTGRHITFGFLEAQDAFAAVAWLRLRFPELPVGAVGVSLGGAALILAGGQPELDAAVVEAVYPTISEAVDNRVRRRVGVLSELLSPLLLLQMKPRLGVNPVQLRPVDTVAAIGCPLLVVSGTEDEHTTQDQTQALFAAAREPKELWLVDGAAHVDLFRYDPVEYRRRILGFFRRHLLS